MKKITTLLIALALIVPVQSYAYSDAEIIQKIEVLSAKIQELQSKLAKILEKQSEVEATPKVAQDTVETTEVVEPVEEAPWTCGFSNLQGKIVWTEDGNGTVLSGVRPSDWEKGYYRLHIYYKQCGS